MEDDSPGTETLHRLLGGALADADLDGDLVPAVVAGYEHRVKVRRYRAGGAALAVVATAGAAVLATPGSAVRGGSDTGTGSLKPAASSASQPADYCEHQNWLVGGPGPDLLRSGGPATDPTTTTTTRADCEALQSALRSLFPAAWIVPAADVDLASDPHLDARLKKILTRAEPSQDQRTILDENLGAELRYVHDHPTNPANFFTPGKFSVVMPGGLESVFEITLVPQDVAPSWLGSGDCTRPPASAPRSCTMVGTPGGWHGALWGAPAGNGMSTGAPDLTASLSNSAGKVIRVLITTASQDAWEPAVGQDRVTVDPINGRIEIAPLKATAWVNRWTGETVKGTKPPTASAALTQAQWIQFLNSPAFQKYADGYLSYVASLPGGFGPPVH